MENQVTVGSKWQQGAQVHKVMAVTSDGEVGWRHVDAPITANGEGVAAERADHFCKLAVFLADRVPVVEAPPVQAPVAATVQAPPMPVVPSEEQHAAEYAKRQPAHHAKPAPVVTHKPPHKGKR